MRVRGGRWGGVHVTPPPVYRRIAPAPAPHTAGAGRGGRDVRHHRHGLLPRAVRRRAGGRAATCHEFGEALEPRQGPAVQLGLELEAELGAVESGQGLSPPTFRCWPIPVLL